MLSEGQLVALLRQRYPSPQFAFFAGVRNSTGYARTVRTADALAMSLWPSRGLALHGFECKSARHDWLRELGDPEKADEIAGYCDFWWIVAGGDNVVKLDTDNAPPTWGVLVPNAKGTLRVVREAKPLEPKPLTRQFLAAVLRRAHEDSPATNAIKDAVNQALTAQQQQHARSIEQMKSSTASL